MKIPETAKFPPTITDIEKALQAIDVAYHMNHRGGEIGHFLYSKVADKSAKLVCSNPYPCDFDRGLILSMAKKFKQKNETPLVNHDDSQPCRKKGAESCTYTIKW